MKPDITIIVPIYNVEKYVSKCLASLLEQTYNNFVVWAVDDGSPDNSKEIVKKFEKKDSRIKLISKKNGGYGSVLEYGVQNIKTKYFLVCDPDDWLDKKALEVLHKNAEKYDTDITVGDRYDVYVQNNEQVYLKSFDNNLNIKPHIVYTKTQEIQKFILGAGTPHAKLFKTSIAKKIKFPHHISYTDTVLYSVALNNAHRVVYIDEPLAYYLTNRPGNTSTDILPKIVEDYVIMWNSIYNQIINSHHNIDYLLLKLYDILHFILYEYRRVAYKSNSKNSYKKNIFMIIKKLTPYTKNINSVASYRSVKEKLFMNCILNRLTVKLTVKYYLMHH